MVILFGAVSFLSAALVFLVQPMVARMVLPTLGGSPQVWTTTMLFFQLAKDRPEIQPAVGYWARPGETRPKEDTP